MNSNEKEIICPSCGKTKILKKWSKTITCSVSCSNSFFKKKSNQIYKTDWCIIQEYHNQGNLIEDVLKHFKISRTLLNHAEKLKLFQKKKFQKKHTEEARRILREKRLLWLKNNPDKHVWKKQSKFKSEPCEIFKKLLKEKNINFIEEYQPFDNRYYSVDIAFPDKKIGIEINGNQHYNSDKTLKPYYQNRHNFFINEGWNLIELHYTFVFSDKVEAFITSLIEENDITNIDYTFYFKKSKPKYKQCKCGQTIHIKSKTCRQCVPPYRKIKERPSLEQLKIDVDTLGYSATGRKYGVSDNAIRKWIKSYTPI
jgi:very-short-patch-repair endonuclease